GPAWHGPSVMKSLKGVSAKMASWRPAPGRNSIWELALHLAYSRYRMIGRLSGKPQRPFPRKRRLQWVPVGPRVTTERSWSEDGALLVQCHDELMRAVQAASAGRLLARRPGNPHTLGWELLSNAIHDAYHAGQINLLKRLYRRRRA